jgi:hypothetical protein
MPAFFVVDVIRCFQVEAASQWPAIMSMMHSSIIIDVSYSAIDAAWKLH